MDRINIKNLKGKSKTERLKIKPDFNAKVLKKPAWIRTKHSNNPKVNKIKNILRKNNLNTVCEEALCPNLNECFSKGSATFMIMGSICTRRCPFCDVAHGKPLTLDKKEPYHLAATVKKMQLNYVVITSVNRDDLYDGGANHFVQCIRAIQDLNLEIKIEILTPDFRGRDKVALDILSTFPADVFNHNLETVSNLYPKVKPGGDYQISLKLLKDFKKLNPNIITKSGLMLGLGENYQDVINTMHNLRENNVDMLTLGQYLQPSKYHLKVERFITKEEFLDYKNIGEKLGFSHVASGAMVRSSYHADIQAKKIF